MAEPGQDACLEQLRELPGDERWRIDAAAVLPNVTVYAVRSFDGDALLFSLPLIISRPLQSEIPLDMRGAAGAVARIIEHIKKRAASDERLGPLLGKGTRFPHQYASLSEPYTLVDSPAALASDLWHADNRNYADTEGIHLMVRGAVPCPPVLSSPDIARITETVARMCDAIASYAFSLPVHVLESAWITTLDQQALRETLPSRSLVSFVGDGARLARHCTRYRCFFRTAGPKEGINVPFACPSELVPLELELAASNRTVTGLGIRQREVFAVAGSNAQGKTTFLEGIIAGMDDHAAGDGRELVVTVPGLSMADATPGRLAAADVSMFFSSLPPGMDGTPRSASGMGSGSMTMACQVQEAITRGAQLLIIDEDRAAPNLLVRSCLQTGEVTPLSEILAGDRGKMGKTALVFAACAMDTLVAQADRIMVLERHEASAINRDVFRRKVAESLRKMSRELE